MIRTKKIHTHRPPQGNQASVVNRPGDVGMLLLNVLWGIPQKSSFFNNLVWDSVPPLTTSDRDLKARHVG